MSSKEYVKFIFSLYSLFTIAVGLAIWLDNAHRQDGRQKGTGSTTSIQEALLMPSFKSPVATYQNTAGAR